MFLPKLLAERDEWLADLAELIRHIPDGIRLTKKFPRRTELKSSGMDASCGGS